MTIPTTYRQTVLFFVSLLIVGLGQPVWSGVCAILAACCGFALFWVSLNPVVSLHKRFWLATAWFTAVQLIQLSWLPSHPYLYIYAVYFLLAMAMGIQFGLLSMGLRYFQQRGLIFLLGLSGFWVLMEWMRLFVLSGLPFNPVGLSLSAYLYPLQTASLAGIYGLSFLVILTNLLALRAWTRRPFSFKPVLLWALVAAAPYFFGAVQIKMHEQAFAQYAQILNTTTMPCLCKPLFRSKNFSPPSKGKIC